MTKLDLFSRSVAKRIYKIGNLYPKKIKSWFTKKGGGQLVVSNIYFMMEEQRRIRRPDQLRGAHPLDGISERRWRGWVTSKGNQQKPRRSSPTVIVVRGEGTVNDARAGNYPRESDDKREVMGEGSKLDTDRKVILSGSCVNGNNMVNKSC